MRYRHTCHRCGEYVAWAALDEIAPAIWQCIEPCRDRRRGRISDLAPAAQRARDTTRDAQVNALRGAPIDEDTRRLLGTWRLMKGSAA